MYINYIQNVKESTTILNAHMKKSGKSSMLDLVSIQSSCRLFLADRPTLTRPYKRVDRMSLMTSSLLLQKRPACLVHVILMVFEIGGMWSYSWGFFCRMLLPGYVPINIYISMYACICVYIYMKIYINI